jgi:hypothetical protein
MADEYLKGIQERALNREEPYKRGETPTDWEAQARVRQPILDQTRAPTLCVHGVPFTSICHESHVKDQDVSVYGTPNWRPEDFQVDPFKNEPPVLKPEWPGEKVLDIEVIQDCADLDRRSKFQWTAHYKHAPNDFGQGSTPHMAILDLISNYNATVEVARINKDRPSLTKEQAEALTKRAT